MVSQASKVHVLRTLTVSRESPIAFSDPVLKARQCLFPLTLFSGSEALGSPQSRRRKIDYYFWIGERERKLLSCLKPPQLGRSGLGRCMDARKQCWGGGWEFWSALMVHPAIGLHFGLWESEPFQTPKSFNGWPQTLSILRTESGMPWKSLMLPSEITISVTFLPS